MALHPRGTAKLAAGFEISGVEEVRTELRNAAEKVPQHAARTMRRAANAIVKKARNYVPEDTGALKNSIRLEGGFGAGGRLELEVVVGRSFEVIEVAITKVVQGIGGNKALRSETYYIDTSRYAAIIHERYNSVIQFPGAKTLAKRAKYGPKVGEKFLQTAADEVQAMLEAKMIQAVTSAIKGEPAPSEEVGEEGGF